MVGFSYAKTLRLFASPFPRDRHIAAIAGVLAYGASRLSAAQYGQFIAWCAGLGLPTSPQEAIATSSRLHIEAMIALIWGMVSEIEQANIHEYAINIGGVTTTVDLAVGGCMQVLTDAGATDGTIGGGARARGSAVLGTLAADMDATLLSASAPASNSLTVGPAAPTAGAPGIATAGPIAAGAFRFGGTLPRGAGEAGAAPGLTMLYAHERLGLVHLKGADGLRCTLAGPLYDSLWLEMRPGVRGTATTDAQQPFQYQLQVDIPTSGPATLVGDVSDVVSAQVFLRRPSSAGLPINDWVSVGGMLCGSIDTPSNLVGTNVQLLYDAGTLSVRAAFQMSPWSPDFAGAATIIEARLLLWARGGF